MKQRSRIYYTEAQKALMWNTAAGEKPFGISFDVGVYRISCGLQFTQGFGTQKLLIGFMYARKRLQHPDAITTDVSV